ncbi:hypothetical protein BVY01_03115 [bacterium I07]|nr:hypothetical protein BVY01_03115 [bacterium I07]
MNRSLLTIGRGSQLARILIIDDEDDIRDVLTRFLQLCGYEVFVAADGRLNPSVEDEMPVDLVVTDIIMPNNEGIETIRKFRLDYPDMKIIAMSGGGSIEAEKYLLLAEKLGAYATLRKPFKLEEFNKLVIQSLSKSGDPQ